MASFNMFGKNNESIQSSERTKNLKIELYFLIKILSTLTKKIIKNIIIS